MELYEINERIQHLFDNAIDTETGEIIDVSVMDEIDALSMERDTMIEQMALSAKNAEANAKMLKAEADAYVSRAKAEERKAKWLKGYLASILNGDKFETLKVRIGWKKSEVVAFDAGKGIYDIDTQFVRMAEPTLAKDEIKRAIKSGYAVEGVHLEERQNLIVK